MHSRTQTEFCSPFILTFLSAPHAAPSPPLPTPSTLFSSLSHFHLCLFFSSRSQNRRICVLKVVKTTKCEAPLNEVSVGETFFFFYIRRRGYYFLGTQILYKFFTTGLPISISLYNEFKHQRNVITLVRFTPDS